MCTYTVTAADRLSTMSALWQGFVTFTLPLPASAASKWSKHLLAASYVFGRPPAPVFACGSFGPAAVAATVAVLIDLRPGVITNKVRISEALAQKPLRDIRLRERTRLGCSPY